MSKDFRKIPPNRLHWYNATDVVTTMDVAEVQRQRIGPFISTWRNLWQPALDALGYVERWGAILSEDNVRTYDTFLGKQIQAKQTQMNRDHGIPPEFNPNTQDLHRLLFEKWKLRPEGKTEKGNPSTDKDALAAMAENNPSVSHAIMDIRELKAYLSARSRAGLGMLKHISFDGRVHTTFGITRSFRLTSSEPNTQNLKSQEDEDDDEDPGKFARGCWVPPDGDVILALDYAQNELRTACWLSGDTKMAAALDGGDFHRATGQGIFQTQDILKWMRRVGKEVNFGIVFGQTDRGLADKLNGIPAADRNHKVFTRSECQGYIDGLLQTYPDLGRYLRRCVRDGEMTGQSVAKWGPWLHCRQVPDMGYPRDDRRYRRHRSHAENVCKNGPIQTVANCIGLDALVRVVQWIHDTGFPAQVNLTVHDSLVLYVREDLWEEAAHTVRDIMLDYGTGIVNLKVDVELGRNDYGTLEKVTL